MPELWQKDNHPAALRSSDRQRSPPETVKKKEQAPMWRGGTNKTETITL